MSTNIEMRDNIRCKINEFIHIRKQKTKEFNQVKYSKDEYIKMISDKNAELENQLTYTQLALTEVYEMML